MKRSEKACEIRLAMPISRLNQGVEEEQGATLPLLGAASREGLAKALLEIALQGSRASTGAVLLSESPHFVPFATSNWVQNTAGAVRFSLVRFALDPGAQEPTARMPGALSMNKVLSGLDDDRIDHRILSMCLTYRGDAWRLCTSLPARLCAR